MLKTTEAVDVKNVLKGFSALGYADQTAMDNDIIFVADQVEINFRDIIGESYYDYLKGLNGVYLDIYQKAVYYGEVYMIARDLMDSVANKNQSNSSGYSMSTKGYSESVSGTPWFTNDRSSLNSKFIKFMYTAGYKVNQVNRTSMDFLNEGEYK